MKIKYDNSNVRRQDRLLDELRAIELLRTAEYGVMSMADTDGEPYAVPVNFVWDTESSIYIHCAPEGKKLRILAKNSKVQLCIIGRVNLLPHKFTTEYESVIISGTARIGLNEDERKKALELILNKLSPNDKEVGMKYAEKSFHRTEIIRIDINNFSGKAKVVNDNQ